MWQINCCKLFSQIRIVKLFCSDHETLESWIWIQLLKWTSLTASSSSPEPSTTLSGSRFVFFFFFLTWAFSEYLGHWKQFFQKEELRCSWGVFVLRRVYAKDFQAETCNYSTCKKSSILTTCLHCRVIEHIKADVPSTFVLLSVTQVHGVGQIHWGIRLLLAPSVDRITDYNDLCAFDVTSCHSCPV